jgi:hypothetical protein
MLVVVSGRRALWLVVALTPMTILLLATVSKRLSVLPRRARRLLSAYCIGTALIIAIASTLPSSVTELGYMRYLRAAFSAQDERSIQKGYLLRGFADAPLIGSGFGAYAGYVRNEERPWTYELTYHQLLFNVGIVGALMIGGLFIVYFVIVIRQFQQVPSGTAIPFGLLVGFCSLFLGAYSNPYLKSFDFLFFAGLLPYLSSFGPGFTETVGLRPPQLPTLRADVGSQVLGARIRS